MQMTLRKRLRGAVWNVLNALSPALLHQVSRRVSRNCWDNWGYRTRQVLASPDNAYIPRVPDAGKVVGDVQIMHNGIKVLVGSYYTQGSIGLLRKNRGVHEPQEERVFQEVLKIIPPGAVMVELGAYWGFYSLWFCREIKGARAFLIEPITPNLDAGRRNFEINDLSNRVEFVHGWIGECSGQAEDGTRVICVDGLIAEKNLDHIHILHSDIQGAELAMLKGAERTIQAGKVWFWFISTHNEEVHRECIEFLQKRGLQVLVSITLEESYSVDGILVACSPNAPKIPALELSKRPSM